MSISEPANRYNSTSRRFSRPTVDRKKRRSTLTELIFNSYVKIARYQASLSKYSRLTSDSHNRSFRPTSINSYIVDANLTGKNPAKDVNLQDFFGLPKTGSSLATARPTMPLRPKNMRGLSLHQSFIYEKRWLCPCWNSKTSEETNKARRPSWVPVSKDIDFSVMKSRVPDPVYQSMTAIDIRDLVRDIVDNSNRIAVGLNYTRRIFGFEPTSQKIFNRPFFTVYVNLVQLVMFIVMITTYGIAPIGFAYQEVREEILMPDLNIRVVSHYELRNFWIGPRQADMIRLGAKFQPCMKLDAGYKKLYDLHMEKVKESGCCINKDGSGCLQTVQDNCMICKLESNASKSPLTVDPTSDFHMKCQLVGRPCCVGLLGQCVMTTREYCQFRRGVFHQDAFLCSQVSCLHEVCGMLPFSEENIPDQFYRSVTSQFLIPGVLALVITWLFQWIVMYDMERLTGTLEMTIIYLGCGVCGSILSNIFMPYYVEAGPSGSQFGVLAAVVVEIVRWNIQESFRRDVLICIAFIISLFLIGLVVPQIDNWAHLTGFVFGVFISISFRPVRRTVSAPLKPVTIKLQRVVGIIVSVCIFIVMLSLFYGLKESLRCDFCLYFNCIPLTYDFCEGTSVNLDYNTMMNTFDV